MPTPTANTLSPTTPASGHATNRQRGEGNLPPGKSISISITGSSNAEFATSPTQAAKTPAGSDPFPDSRARDA
jgi:hypothetical protein